MSEEKTELTNHHKKVIGVASMCYMLIRQFNRTMGNLTQPEWDKAPPEVHERYVQGVIFVSSKVRTLEEIHDHWVETRVSQGWAFGLELSEENKTHPCLIPYEMLPIEEHTKSALFLSTVMAISPLLVRVTQQEQQCSDDSEPEVRN